MAIENGKKQLSKVLVNNELYYIKDAIARGLVVANPVDESETTDTLSTIKIGDTYYRLESSGSGGLSETQIRNLLAGLGVDGKSVDKELENIVSKNVIALDGYSIIDPNDLDESGNPKRKIIIKNITDEEAEKTAGRVFNDVDTVLYLAGNNSNPIYMSLDKDGNVKVEDIALKSDIHSVDLNWGQLGSDN